jgi:hypothetical protein
VAPRRPILLAAAALLVVLGAGLSLVPVSAGAQTAPTTSSARRVPGSGAKEERLASENRRMIAVIGGLIVVALALTVLTIRYIRVTKPEARAPAPIGRHGRTVTPAPDQAPPADPTVPPSAAPAVPPSAVTEASPADHGGADVDWEPRGTGEHDRVEVGATPATPRPRRSDRAAALGRSQG